jgi:hypothetical protein
MPPCTTFSIQWGANTSKMEVGGAKTRWADRAGLPTGFGGQPAPISPGRLLRGS